MMPAALEVKSVSGGYGHTTIVRDVSLEVAPGSVTALLGPNGAGKTTLLKTIAGLLRPSAGSVMIDGEDVTGLRPNQRDRLGLCLIPEGRGIYRSLTVRENLALQALPGTEGESAARAIDAFPVLGERLAQVAGTLSGGQQQMLAMARAYVRDPKVILVDEASLGLAPIVVDAIFAFLETVTRAGAALVLVDQFVTRALDLADRAYVLRRGEIVFAGAAAELRTGDVFERYLGAD